MAKSVNQWLYSSVPYSEIIRNTLCPTSDYSYWTLWQYQCTGQDPTGLLLWAHIHPSMGE